jgi:hypothetical protein
MVSAVFDGGYNLSCDRCIAPGWVGVTGEAQVNGLPGNLLPPKLRFKGFDKPRSRLHAGVKFLSFPVEDIGRKAVVAAVGAAGVDVHGIVPILFCFPLWNI